MNIPVLDSIAMSEESTTDVIMVEETETDLKDNGTCIEELENCVCAYLTEDGDGAIAFTSSEESIVGSPEELRELTDDIEAVCDCSYIDTITFNDTTIEVCGEATQHGGVRCRVEGYSSSNVSSEQIRTAADLIEEAQPVSLKEYLENHDGLQSCNDITVKYNNTCVVAHNSNIATPRLKNEEIRALVNDDNVKIGDVVSIDGNVEITVLDNRDE